MYKIQLINFKIDYLHANVSIYSDKIKIYEIAKNIIHNALKYTEKGFVLCDIFVENNILFFNVYDSGIGISEENIKNIFIKRFQKRLELDIMNFILKQIRNIK